MSATTCCFHWHTLSLVLVALGSFSVSPSAATLVDSTGLAKGVSASFQGSSSFYGGVIDQTYFSGGGTVRLVQDMIFVDGGSSAFVGPTPGTGLYLSGAVPNGASMQGGMRMDHVFGGSPAPQWWGVSGTVVGRLAAGETGHVSFGAYVTDYRGTWGGHGYSSEALVGPAEITINLPYTQFLLVWIEPVYALAVSTHFTYAFTITRSSGVTSDSYIAFNYAKTNNTLPVMGDYDRDSDVDGRDFLVWQRAFGSTGAGLFADGNNDGAVNAADYGVWRDHFGTVGGSGFAAIAEPASIGQFGLALVILAASRNRRGPR